MKFRRHRGKHSAIEASSLSDILFFLLLFFLMISTLASPNAIKLLLPKATTGQSIPKQIIDVSINASLEYYVNTNRTDLPSLKESIAKESSKLSSPTIVLRVDKQLSVEKVIEVIDVVNQLKLPLVVATDKGK